MMYVMCKIVATRVCQEHSKYQQFTKSRQLNSQLCLFEAIKSLEFDVQDMGDSFGKAIRYNQKREKNAKKKEINKKTVFSERSAQLSSLRKIFNEKKDLQFIGLVGWGDGCVSSTLKKFQDISAVDGVLYKEQRTGDSHYLRLGTCLEQFLKYKDHDVKSSTHLTMTTFGVDINLTKHQFLITKASL